MWWHAHNLHCCMRAARDVWKSRELFFVCVPCLRAIIRTLMPIYWIIFAKVVLHWWHTDSRMQVFFILFYSIRMEMRAGCGRSPLVSFTLFSHAAFFFHCPGFMRIQASRKKLSQQRVGKRTLWHGKYIRAFVRSRINAEYKETN